MLLVRKTIILSTVISILTVSFLHVGTAQAAQRFPASNWGAGYEELKKTPNQLLAIPEAKCLDATVYKPARAGTNFLGGNRNYYKKPGFGDEFIFVNPDASILQSSAWIDFPKQPVYTIKGALDSDQIVDASEGFFGGEVHHRPIIWCDKSWLEKNYKNPQIFDGGGNLSNVEGIIVDIINWLIVLVGQIGLWLFDMSTQLVMLLIPIGVFVQNGFVRQGWPFIQGIANIGFIIALLAIAVGTTLRIESYNVKRLLPRLLIGALLINFSLLIAGILIDASKVVMAIELNIFNNDVASIAKGILQKSGLPETAAQFVAPPNPNSWTVPFQLGQKAIMIWALALAMIYLTVLLFVRYVALLILLVFSPLPFLAIALPKTAPLAQQWWTQFLKWVMFGPIVLLFLIFIVQASQSLSPKLTSGVFESFTSLAIMCALIILSAKAGTMLGGAGAAGAIAFTNRRLQQTRRGAVGTGKFVGRQVDQRSGFKDFRENYKKSRDARSKQSFLRRKGGEAGKKLGGSRVVGGATGVAGGAAAGAAVGSVIPIVGTAVGAVAGAAIGGYRGQRRTKQEKEKLDATNKAKAAIQDSIQNRTNIANDPNARPTSLRNIDVDQLSIGEIRHAVASDKTSQAQKEELLKRPEVVAKILKEDDPLINEILTRDTNVIDDHSTNTGDPALDDLNRTQNRQAKQHNAESKALIKALNKGLEEHDKKKKEEDSGSKK